MNCPNCGAENAATSNFCTSCGAPLVGSGNAGPAQGAAHETPGAASPAQDAVARTQASAYATSPGSDASGASASANPAANSASGQEAPQGTPYMPPNPAQAYSYQNAYQQHVTPETTYAMTSTDEAVRLANFVLCVISCVALGAAIVPLAWTIPMTVHSWGIYKGKKPNTIAFGVCTLIFVNVIGGILLLVSNKDR